ncbi:MAG TPA: protein kinase [Gemmatimonadaceae bacterium]|nr:protein kinase [Gemmatimonadaceae bacterium]
MPVPGLSDRYRDPTEVERGREGTWYSASLQDGSAARVLVLGPELAALVRDPARFFETLDRASRIRHDCVRGPRAWGQLPNGDVHVAFADLPGAELLPGSMSAAEISATGAAFARALAAVHSTGLVDGALRRPGLIRGDDGRLELREFGLLPALIAGGADPRVGALSLSETHYVSPEVQNGGVPDERSDVYSLGAVLYELLTGKPPYGGRTTAYVMATVLADEIDTAPDAQAQASPEATNPVVDALIRAIERSPEDRWPSAAAFADALEAGRAVTPSDASRRKAGCLPTVTAAVALAVGVFGLLR